MESAAPFPLEDPSSRREPGAASAPGSVRFGKPVFSSPAALRGWRREPGGLCFRGQAVSFFPFLGATLPEKGVCFPC